MGKKRHTVESIVAMLREAVGLYTRSRPEHQLIISTSTGEGHGRAAINLTCRTSPVGGF
jgi:hypothetical protein